jgi:hypothetical protein
MGYTFTIPLLIVNFIVYVPGALAFVLASRRPVAGAVATTVAGPLIALIRGRRHPAEHLPAAGRVAVDATGLPARPHRVGHHMPGLHSPASCASRSSSSPGGALAHSCYPYSATRRTGRR